MADRTYGPSHLTIEQCLETHRPSIVQALAQRVLELESHVNKTGGEPESLRDKVFGQAPGGTQAAAPTPAAPTAEAPAETAPAPAAPASPAATPAKPTAHAPQLARKTGGAAPAAANPFAKGGQNPFTKPQGAKKPS